MLRGVSRWSPVGTSASEGNTHMRFDARQGWTVVSCTFVSLAPEPHSDIHQATLST
ncbi:hypothetical protein THICB3540002 [Thiomonas sp. CB3]|nr:hypothetical protein THICB3540002 [Thiomonas sp. CB3]